MKQYLLFEKKKNDIEDVKEKSQSQNIACQRQEEEKQTNLVRQYKETSSLDMF